MTTEADKSIGYHIRVRHRPWRVIVVHAPSENWQHRPRGIKPKDGFWRGPFTSKSRAEQIAEDLADELGHDIELCKKCFPHRFPPHPTRDDHVRGIRGRRKHQRERSVGP